MITLREYLNNDNTLSLLEEGGLAGHLSHLYDNKDLSFRDIKQILNSITTGDLQVVEKTDGQNIFLGFDIQTQTAKAARNKGQIKTDGVNWEQFESLFMDRPEQLRKSFVEAIRSFENVVSNIDRNIQMLIFGPDTNIFYNCEIVNNMTSNVIKYDKNYIIIHTTGHIINKPFNNFSESDIYQNVDRLGRILDQTQQEYPTYYKFTIDPVIQLKKLENDTVLNSTIRRINNLQKIYNLNDDNNIADYLVAYFEKLLLERDIIMPEDSLIQNIDIINKIISMPGSYNASIIYKNLKNVVPSYIINDIREIIVNRNKFYKEAIIPLENIIHDFAVEILKGVHSVFIGHPAEEIKRLQKEVEQSIFAIKSSDDERAHELLRKQLEKLKGIDRITSSLEGVVFTYKNNVYKFTGNFAPINQLLGFYRYGR